MQNASLRTRTFADASADRHGPDQSNRSRLATSLTLAAMSLGYGVVQLDVTIVNTALNSIDSAGAQQAQDPTGNGVFQFTGLTNNGDAQTITLSAVDPTGAGFTPLEKPTPRQAASVSILRPRPADPSPASRSTVPMCCAP